MTERFASSDAHAYVDDCLGREERIAFEAKLREDPALRRRVETWRAQNDAIRAAFRTPPRARGPLSLGRPSNENASPPPSPASDSRRSVETRSDSPGAAARAAPARASRPVARAAPRGVWAPALRPILILSLAAVLLALSAVGGARDERGALIRAGLAAFRAFGVDSSVALDIATSDARALAKKLAPRYVGDPAASRLELPGWTLIGARFVPGTVSTAAFVLWENAARARIGLLIEPLDAPAGSPPRTGDFGGVAASAWTAGGAGFAAIGPYPSGVGQLVRAARGAPGIAFASP